MSTKELQEKLVSAMTRWQEIEDAAVATTEHIIEKTSHPLIRTVMEIIQTDSKRHHQVQQMISESFGFQWPQCNRPAPGCQTAPVSLTGLPLPPLPSLH